MNDDKIKKWMCVSGYIIAAAAALGPFLYMLTVSFADTQQLFAGNGFKLTAMNYKSVLSGGDIYFTRCLVNSIVVSLISSALTVIISGFAAYATARMNFRGKMAVLVGVLCLSLFPQISVAGYIFKLLSAAGIINTYTGLVLPYLAWSLPLCLWILVSYFMSMPEDIDRAAAVDGAGNLQIMYHIILPLAMPGIITAFIVTFIFTLNEFLFALMFTVDSSARTVPVAIALFTGMHGETPWGEIMAAAAVTTVPIILIAAVFQKRIIQGLTQGAVK